MSRIAAWVVCLERLREQRARKPERPWWWELQHGGWHFGAVGLSHKDALADVDTMREAEGENESDAV